MGKRRKRGDADGRCRPRGASRRSCSCSRSPSWPPRRSSGTRSARRRPTPGRARAISRLRPGPKDLNVVVVTLDTTRADRLGCYGFGGIETPNIDGLAREGVVFEHATASRPAHLPVALLDLHRASSLRTTACATTAASSSTTHASRSPSGSTTRASRPAPSSAPGCSSRKWGLAQGFDEYSDKFDLSKYKVISLGTVQKPGDEVMDDALAWLETREAAALLRAGSTSTTRTRPTSRPSPSRRAIRASRTSARSPTPTRWSGGCIDWLRQDELLERTLVVVTARPRREPRRPRRVDARLLRLRLHDARAARRADALGPQGTPLGAGLERRPDADRARPARPSRAARDRRALARARDPGSRCGEPGADRLLRDLLPALPLRLAAPARDPQPRLQVRRRARARALRPRAGPRRDQEHLPRLLGPRGGAAAPPRGS